MPADHLTNLLDQIFKLGQDDQITKKFLFDVLVFVNRDKHRVARPQVKPTGLSINQFRTLATTAESGSCSAVYCCTMLHCYI